MANMAAFHGSTLVHGEPSMRDQDIFTELLAGVDERSWWHHAAELRMRGYSIFDLTERDTTKVEIIDPDCAHWWQLVAGQDGQWRVG